MLSTRHAMDVLRQEEGHGKKNLLYAVKTR